MLVPKAPSLSAMLPFELRRAAHLDGSYTIKDLQNGGEDPADPEGGSSSGSSTLEGTEDLALQIKDDDEEAPLLHDGHTLRPLHPRRSFNPSV